MLKKIIFCAFILSCLSSAYAMEEDPGDASSQYLTILKKAYQGDPKSIDGFHDCLMRQSPQSRKKFLSFLHEMASDPCVLSEVMARQIKSFIDFSEQEDDSNVCVQYFSILQKAYLGDSDSIEDLYYALTTLKGRSHSSEYKQKLGQLYNQALNSKVSPKEYAICIKSFIKQEVHRLRLSPLTHLPSIPTCLGFSQQGHHMMEEDLSLPSSSTSPITSSCQEEEVMTDQQQYKVILQRASEVTPYSQGPLYDCLERLKKIHPNDYEEKLSWFYKQAVSPGVSSEEFARCISKFIERERRRLREDLSLPRSSTSPKTYSYQEEIMSERQQYLAILQKAYQGDQKSIDGLHNALRNLKERSHSDCYKKKLSQLYDQVLNPDISSETCAKRIIEFIQFEKLQSSSMGGSHCGGEIENPVIAGSS